MADYQRLSQRFACRKGINLRADVDAMPEGQAPILENVRPYLDDRITSRPGMTAQTSPAIADLNLHSVRRLNDASPFAGRPFTRLVGAGTNLYSGVTGLTNIDSGYSGNPLGLVPMQTDGAPRPWMYVADLNLFRKVDVDNNVYNVGLPPPVAAPSAILSSPTVTTITDFNAIGPWVLAGATYATAPAVITRINTTISAITYDSGNTGWANVALTLHDANVQPGIFVTIAAAEVCLIQDVKSAMRTTTIAAISYDTGATGLCTIQPTIGVGLGMVDSPVAGSADRVMDDPSAGDPPSAPRSRLYDIAADSLVQLGGTEYVRVLSVTVGRDGVQSFRCSTAGTFAAGNAVAGLPSIRVFTTGTRAAGDAVATSALRNTLVPTTPAPSSMTGGISAVLAVNMASNGSRPTQPDDEIHLSIRVNNLNQITEGRIYFDVDATAATFLSNYYFYAFRPSDIYQAIQSTNAGGQQTITTARLTAVQRAAIDQTGQFNRRLSKDPDSDIDYNNVGVDNALSGSIGVPDAGAVSGQMGTGNDQWAELRFKVRDLQRVGSDRSRTLANVAAIQILVTCAGTATLQIDYDAMWFGGGYGPDVGIIGAPYVYCHRPRSTITGAVGNPSPAMRSGVLPRRQAVVVLGEHSSDAQCDRQDWFRLGGALSTWKYLGTTNNDSPPTITDVFPDSVIASAPGLDFDNFKPWPVVDKPRTGVCTVVGTTVIRVSGDAFNPNWAPGTSISIHNQPYTLYAQPASTSRMELLENGGALTNVTWTMQDPLLLGAALPYVWGDYQGFVFGAGDLINPARLYWTHGNNPEATSDANYLDVTNPGEIIQNGFMWDGRPWVHTSDWLYEVIATPGQASAFNKRRTPCAQGLWASWAFAVGPLIYFLSDDGIYATDGSKVISLTEDALYPLFPHDGVPGVLTRGFYPPDMTQTNALRLTYEDGWLYFDYKDTQGAKRCLAFYEAGNAWFPDVYTPAENAHGVDEGDDAHALLICASDGKLYKAGGTLDGATAIPCHARTPSWNMGDPRVLKQFGDVAVDLDAAGGAGVATTIGFNKYANTLAPTTIGAAVSGEVLTVLDIQSGAGYLAKDVALDLTWSQTNTANPTLFWWQPSFLPKVENTLKRATDWESAGYDGAKFVQGVIIRCDTGGVDKILQVQTDNGAVVATITVNATGETEVAKDFSNVAPNTGPFIGHLVRLVSTDSVPWRYYGARWVFEPSPELATLWRTQPTTHDLSGYQHLKDAFIAYIASAAVEVRLIYDGDATEEAYTLPSTAGAYAKTYLPLRAKKFKAVEYQLSSTAGVRLFQRDTEFRVMAWGSADGYQVVRPFGDLSRIDGARI